MRKSNLFKGIVCGLMLTAVVGTSIVAVSAAQSGTTAQIKVSNGDYVLDVEDYYDTYDGTYGSFYVNGSTDETSIKVVNDTYATHKYYIEAMAYNHNAQRYDFVDYEVVTLGVYGNSTVTVSRDFDSALYRYDHTGKSYYSTESTSVVIDNYQCSVYQYN